MSITNFLAALTALSTVASAAAITQPYSGIPPRPNNLIKCGEDQYHVVDYNGEARIYPAASLFWNTTGCIDKPVQVGGQSNEADTDVDLNDNDVRVEWFQGLTNDQVPAHPPQFKELWDGALAQCAPNECTNVEVSVAKRIRSQPSDGRSVVLRADGRFPSGDRSGTRNQYFELLREAFDRAVQGGTMSGGSVGRGRWESGPGYLYANEFGSSLRIEIMDSEPTRACDPIAQTVNSFGSLVPHLAPIFGFASAVCVAIGS